VFSRCSFELVLGDAVSPFIGFDDVEACKLGLGAFLLISIVFLDFTNLFQLICRANYAHIEPRTSLPTPTTRPTLYIHSCTHAHSRHDKPHTESHNIPVNDAESNFGVVVFIINLVKSLAPLPPTYSISTTACPTLLKHFP
jgi:hypothetical protein